MVLLSYLWKYDFQSKNETTDNQMKSAHVSVMSFSLTGIDAQKILNSENKTRETDSLILYKYVSVLLIQNQLS